MDDKLSKEREFDQDESAPGRQHMIRAVLRVDFYLWEQTIAWSFSAYEHPVATVIRNEVDGDVGMLLADVALQEIGEQLADLFDTALRTDVQPPVKSVKADARRRDRAFIERQHGGPSRPT